MRIGTNPEKNAASLSGYGRHRVIVSIYIPHIEGYFARAIEVFRLCVEALLPGNE